MPRRRVLVAEDDPSVRGLLLALLESLGWEPSAVRDGQAAWDWLRAGNACDLLLTDVNMPHVGGIALLRAVRGALPHLRVVVMSGDPSNRPSALDGGAQGFLPKPFGLRELSALLERLPLAPCLAPLGVG